MKSYVELYYRLLNAQKNGEAAGVYTKDACAWFWMWLCRVQFLYAADSHGAVLPEPSATFFTNGDVILEWRKDDRVLRVTYVMDESRMDQEQAEVAYTQTTGRRGGILHNDARTTGSHSFHVYLLRFYRLKESEAVAEKSEETTTLK